VNLKQFTKTVSIGMISKFAIESKYEKKTDALEGKFTLKRGTFTTI
jgi:hypothetical protein